MSGFQHLELEADVLERARRGEPSAQEAVFRAFERPVATLTRRLIARRAIADELAQEVFVDVLLGLGQYDGRGSFAGWVRAIAVRRCLMHLRSPWQRGQRWLQALTDDLETDEIHARTAVHEHADEQIDLERAFARLGDAARVVVWLHDVEGYTHAQIGELLGGTASLSKSRLNRAHAQLRRLLAAHRGPDQCLPEANT